MIFVNGLIVGFLLGAVAFGVLAILMLVHRRPPIAPTMHRRKWRDAPVEVVPKWEKEEGVQYRFMGVGNEAD